MKKFLKINCMALIILFIFNGIIGCNKDSEPIDSENGNLGESSFNITDLNGLWMETHYTILKSSAGGSDETIYLDGKAGGNNYKYCRISADKEEIMIQWLSYPSLTVIKNVKLHIEGNRLLNGTELFGTVIKCSDKVGSSEPSLIIEWEESAQPFNINGQFPETAYYIRDTWSK